MAFSDYLRLIKISVSFLLPFVWVATQEKVAAVIHKWTYKLEENPKNIVIVGGSFAGVTLAQKLVRSIPTGYRVVLIERNSHFNYTFNFPRYSVFAHPGHEKFAFIPYDGIAKGAPPGIFEHVRGEAVGVDGSEVHVKDREPIPYAYLVFATGSSSTAPAKLDSTDRDSAVDQLQAFQRKIQCAKSVAVVGGGAVGVELVADIKSWYAEKDVTLVHSRAKIMNRFGARLQDHVEAKLVELGVKLALGRRPEVLPALENGSQGLRFGEEDIIDYDLVITCTGQIPNTAIIADFLPDAVSASTGRILVSQTLRVSSKDETAHNIFAIGDVAETGGPKMARAASLQSFVVKDNILSLIGGRKMMKTYRPIPEIEGALKLTLGRNECVIYTATTNGSDVLITSTGGSDDLEAEKAWKMFGADIKIVKAS